MTYTQLLESHTLIVLPRRYNKSLLIAAYIPPGWFRVHRLTPVLQYQEAWPDANIAEKELPCLVVGFVLTEDLEVGFGVGLAVGSEIAMGGSELVGLSKIELNAADGIGCIGLEV